MNIQEKLGKVIKDERLRQGLTLTEVAIRTFGDRRRSNEVSRIEQGETNFKIQTIMEISLALNYDLNKHVNLKPKK